ncbi:MAG: HTH domain-containing protein [Candidatus Heimdallarchaeota archaeon]
MNPHPTSLSFFATKPEAQPRQIHIWEFPQRFRVQLDPRVTEGLVNCAAEKVGGIEQLARLLKIGTSIYNYRARRIFIPISTLLKLCKLAGDEFAIEKLEPLVVAYKGGAGIKQPILNPKIPLVETPDLFALMGHLMGDGGYSGFSAYYGNTNEALIRKFIRLLQAVFGGVPVLEFRRRDLRKFTTVRFGLTIVRFLRYLYKVDFRTFTARVPRRLFELPREYAAAFLRAFGDDEGTMQDCWIALCSANRELMQDINALVQAKFPDLDEGLAVHVENKKNGKFHKYTLRFRSGSLESYRAFIGFDQSEKKQELERILARRARGWKVRARGKTRRMLLELLLASSTPMTAKELARRLNVTNITVWHHLKGQNGLISLGFVVSKAKMVLEITERGRKFLQLPSIELLSNSQVGRRKVEILKALAGGSLTVGEIGQKLGLDVETIRFYLNGRKNSRNGRWSPGLLELGLVSRSGRGTSTDPYIYRLTDEGKQFLMELKTFFSAFLAST